MLEIPTEKGEAMMKGIFYGTGIGPGDPELVTIKARIAIEKCPVIVLPNPDRKDCIAYKTAEKLGIELKNKIIVETDFPMTKENEVLEKAWNETADSIAQYLDEGKDVCFLTIGDPSVYSTCMYVEYILMERGYSTKIIPGVTSFTAAACSAGIDLASQDEKIHVIPGSYDIEETFYLDGTLVFMKSGKKLEKLFCFLIEQKKNYDFDFCAVSNCSFEDEVIVEDLSDVDRLSGYLTTVIVKNIREKNLAEREDGSRFFQNTSCRFFPCHKTENKDDFNCMFCFCPLYFLGDRCGGNFYFTEKGIKSCLNCSVPHDRKNYELITEKLKMLNAE